jgi:AcrR family transcriptional regulator
MTQPSPPTKSQRTRAAILDAARRLFAERGYERATVREIAAAARIDPAMVIRYFGSKDELFARASELDLALPDLARVPAGEIGRVLAGHFVALWDDPELGPRMTIMLKAAAADPEAAQRVQATFAAQVLPAIARAAPAAEVPLRGGLVSSQLLGFALCRYVLRLPPLSMARVSAGAKPAVSSTSSAWAP